MKATKIAALLLGLALPAAAVEGAYGAVIGGGGNRGASGTSQGTCKYSPAFGPFPMQIRVPTPSVSGANRRRWTRSERTYVRYRVYATNAFGSFATLAISNWSGYIRVRESDWRTWSGPATTFSFGWRENYGADIRIEWWNSRRMIGWRAHRLTSFAFYDQYNVGPFGPISSCYKYTAY